MLNKTRVQKTRGEGYNSILQYTNTYKFLKVNKNNIHNNCKNNGNNYKNSRNNYKNNGNNYKSNYSQEEAEESWAYLPCNIFTFFLCYLVTLSLWTDNSVMEAL